MRTNPARRVVLAFLRSSAGNIAIITALLIPVIVGFCALATETSYWYYRHRVVQDAADIAAYGAAVVQGRGREDEDTDVAAIAKADALTNGWRQRGGSITVKQTGPLVEVVLVESQQRYFSRFLCGNSPVQISARGVAIGIGGQARLVWDEEPKGLSKRVSSCGRVAPERLPQAPEPQEPESERVRAKTDGETANGESTRDHPIRAQALSLC